MNQDLKNVCYRLYEAMEKGSQLIGRYNALPRSYEGYELFPVETHTLQKIGQLEPVTTKQLADDMEKTPSAVSQIVKKLKVHGLVKLTKNPQNNRETFISLNETGRKIYLAHELLDSDMMEKFAVTLHDFPKNDLEKCIRIQQRLNEKFAENLQKLQESNGET